jgi:chromosome segregation ATPase
MVFRMWRSDKESEQEIAHQYIENIKKAESNIQELQLKIHEYEGAFDKINNFLNQFEEKGKESSNQITDVYEKLQSIYEKDEINTEKIYQLENELNAYKEEIKFYRNEMEALERRIKEVQTVPTATETAPVTDSSKSKSKGKKKRNIEFANQKQIFQQGGFRETIQRVYPQEGSDHQKRSNRKLKEPAKSRFVSNQDLTNQYYPKDIKPARMTVFNPFKYS